MSVSKLTRTYRLLGLDRELYLSPPQWPEGTFRQSRDTEGDLVLVKDVASKAELVEARAELDGIANRFRLAIEHRTGCPLSLKLVESQEPYFDPPGVVSGRSTVRVTASADVMVKPRHAPPLIEQLHEGAERWVRTLAEALTLRRFPDEQIKRYYLVIEELKASFASALPPDQEQLLDELRWVRNFVSHAQCSGPEVVGFITQQLPSAVVPSLAAPAVRFDRTDIEHMNFVGRYVPKASDVAHRLLREAIAALP